MSKATDIVSLKAVWCEDDVARYRTFAEAKAECKGLEGEEAENYIYREVSRYRHWVEKAYELK